MSLKTDLLRQAPPLPQISTCQINASWIDKIPVSGL